MLHGIFLEINFVSQQVLVIYTLARMINKIIFGLLMLWMKRNQLTKQVLFVQNLIHYQEEL
jgi:hypothetical protein